MARDSFECPNCGADVPAKAKACPECGADEQTGWKEDTRYDGTGIEDPDEFDYEDWKRRELGTGPAKPAIGWLWWFVALVLVIVSVWFLLKH